MDARQPDGAGVSGVLLDGHPPIGELPTVNYIPDYISEEEESSLLLRLSTSKAKWTQISGRRLQVHGGTVHAKGLIPTKLPDWLLSLTTRLHKDAPVFGPKPPNHILVNSYMPGEGIMAHEDGPLYVPGVCILSLGSPAILRFRKKIPGQVVEAAAAGDGPPADAAAAGPPVLSVVCMPRSVVVFREEAYTACLHGIDEVVEEELDASVANLHYFPDLTPGGSLPRSGERISLTVRRVLKTLPSLIRL